jgi:choline dehydrogenase-like flavoprotein
MSSNAKTDAKPFIEPRLAKNLSVLWPHGSEPNRIWDVVVVGSGYGGSVAASMLAESVSELSICVLERGREYLPGEFPAAFDELPTQVRAGQQNSGEVVGNHEGLFDVRLGDDVVALVANGLGGGSLINAGVMLEPNVQELRTNLRASGRSSEEIESNPFLLAIDGDQGASLFQEARRMLGAEVKRDDKWQPNTIGRHKEWQAGGPLRKTVALMELARSSHKNAQLTPITVAMDDAPNHAGVHMNACTLCGDCMTGCNVGAKDSLDANLLRKARARKVDIYTGATVLSVKRGAPAVGQSEGHWVLRVAHTDPKLQRRESRLLFIKARKVVLAAGALGTTEILLRSRDDRLVFSDKLGEGFSCNGDNLAAAHDLAEPTGIGAHEDQSPIDRHIGPTITATIKVDDADTGGPFHVQEFAVPAPMKRLFDEIVTTAHVLHALPNADTAVHGDEHAAEMDPLAVSADRMERTLLVGVVGHDAARGSVRLANPIRPSDGFAQQGAVNIYWPQARSDLHLDNAHDRLVEMVDNMSVHRASKVSKPILVSNPMWRLLPPALESLVSQPRGPVLTVHPLGGCPIGTDASRGVVDGMGTVFNQGDAGADNWQGTLIVLDGSIVPQSLGVNPALTITALALRAMKLHCSRWGYVRADESAASGPVPLVTRPVLPKAAVQPGSSSAPRHTEVEVVERLRGPVSLISGDPSHLWMVELTLAYRPEPVRSLMSTLSRTLHVNPDSDHSRLRIYDKDDWDRLQLRDRSDAARDAHVQLEVRIHKGNLSFLHRERSGPTRRRLRGLWAWLNNRGLRDTWQGVFSKELGTLDTSRVPRAGWLRKAVDLWDLASHAGEVRRFDYRIELGAVVHDRLKDRDGRPLHFEFERAILQGHKRLTYDRRANPWRQLTRMTITEMPGVHPGTAPVLDLDLGFLAGQGVPLLQIRRQRNQAHALAELASFVLYLTRLLLSVHLWTFRKPDTPSVAEPIRLPGSVKGLPAPIVTELLVDETRDTRLPVKVRLTRYPCTEPGAKPALVMIHGYSVSGTTFTHPTLQPSAAQALWQPDREVWVVDLRTSSGMPTAKLPWSMEQPALIDIPAALLHIRKATGRPVDVLAHCIGCAMLSMAILTDARSIRSSQTQLGVNSWLTSEHFGTLTAFNGSPVAGAPHPCVRTIVLSQKGPVLRYTDDNVFRAFIMQYARRWLLRGDYQFRRSSQVGVAEDLLDRLLSSVPYPDEDYDVENPRWPWAKRPWTASRHRMDALYGRDFSADNVSHDTLCAIDDLFGPMNLDTVAQTIHFAQFNAITNQRGRGEFVTRARLHQRWSGIPTLLLHGNDNGLADVSTHVLLEFAFAGAGVPYKSIPPYEGMGHQDVLIGLQTQRVFEDVAAFLDRPPALPERRRAVELERLVCEAPWIGPRIGSLKDGDGVRIACRARPDQGNATLWLIPSFWEPKTGCFGIADFPEALFFSAEGSSNEWLFVNPDVASLPTGSLHEERRLGWLALFIYAVGETTNTTENASASERSAPDPDDHRAAVQRSAVAPAARFLDDEPPPVAAQVPQVVQQALAPGGVAPPVVSADDGRGGDSVVGPIRIRQPSFHHYTHVISGLLKNKLLHTGGSIDLTSMNFVRLATSLQGADVDKSAEAPDLSKAPVDMARDVLELARAWLASVESEPKVVSQCFVRLHDLLRAVHAVGRVEPATQRDGVTIALASCQYPQGLLDRPVAQASLRAMVRQLDRLDGAMFVGDQIYADATAGLVDPTRRDELFDQPHGNALRAQALREVHRRIPAYFLLDDHELHDNWEPLSKAVKKSRPALFAKIEATRENGLRAFQQHQRMQPEALRKKRLEPADQSFTLRGYPVRMLDTRTGRSPRGSVVAPNKVSLLSGRQWAELDRWLGNTKRAVKFIATPSVLLPRRRSVAEGVGHEVSSDGWDGFPASLLKLLHMLLRHEAHNTVFLSGDEHHGFCAQVRVRRKGSAAPALKIVSIHTAALYAPFPFANGSPHDFMARDTFDLGDLSIEVETEFAPPGDGFAVVEIDESGPGAVVRVQHMKALERNDEDATLIFPLADPPPATPAAAA